MTICTTPSATQWQPEIYGYIYKIENLVNGKVYIGQSVDAEQREKQHFNNLKANNHSNPYLQNSFNKYGERYFIFNIINWANTKTELDILEVYFINKYDSLNRTKGYNLKEGGSYGKHSPESIKRMIDNHIGMLGKNHSIETRKRMSKTRKGKKLSLEHCRSISEGKKGKKPSLEHLEKIREARIGTKNSIEHRKKIRESRLVKKGSWHGYNGTSYCNKKVSPWRRVWDARIRYNNHTKSLGSFNDPLSAELVYNLVKNEIYNGVEA